MDEENITSESLPEETLEDSADGEEAVGSVTPEENVVAKALSEALGKDFPDDETALKSVKDTFSYVGKKQEAPTPSVDTDNLVTREQFETEMFYKDNPVHAQHRDLLDALANKHGVPVQEAANLESYQGVLEKVQGYDESQNAKSVLESNPRLGAVRDKMKSSREHLANANQATDSYQAESEVRAARQDAVSGVLDLLD